MALEPCRYGISAQRNGAYVRGKAAWHAVDLSMHPQYCSRLIADRALYMQSVYMQSIVEKWANIDFAVISAGAPPNYYENNMQVPLDRMIDMINENYGKPVGDICAFRINIKGEFVNNDYNSRIIGIGEEYLKKAGKVMADYRWRIQGAVRHRRT